MSISEFKSNAPQPQAALLAASVFAIIQVHQLHLQVSLKRSHWPLRLGCIQWMASRLPLLLLLLLRLLKLPIHLPPKLGASSQVLLCTGLGAAPHFLLAWSKSSWRLSTCKTFQVPKHSVPNSKVTK